MAVYLGRSISTLGLHLSRSLKLAITATVIFPLAVGASECLRYNSPEVNLVGTVMLQTFYGPPNYGETPDQDARETQALLTLTAPICVDGDDNDDAAANQTVVTLVPLGFSLTQYVGKTVEVRGSLYGAQTGHHHTPVLITIRKSGDIKLKET